MKNIFLFFFILVNTFHIQAQGTLCNLATPFCAGVTPFTFPAGVNSGTGQSGPNYGCLENTPNPAWYYLQISQSGNIEFEIHTTPHEDVDFICWGPFTSYTTPCVAQLTGSNHVHTHHSSGSGGGFPSINIIDCSYDPSWQEWCYLPNAVAGKYYILLITNYSNNPCNITFSQISGNGTTNCSIFPPSISSNSPICEGGVLQLTANLIANAQYHWSGPNNFNSNNQNPVINNVSSLHSGTYSCFYTTTNGTSLTATTNVIVLQKPITSNIFHNN